MSEYISLGLILALLVFVVFGIFWGLIRGLRKTASRGIFLIITTIVLLFTTPLITKALCGIKINVFIELANSTIDGKYNIEEILNFFINDFIGGEFTTNYPEFSAFIISIPLIFINSIVYLVLFWILKVLLYPLNYLFYKLTFAPRIKKENLGFADFNNPDSNDGKFIIKDPKNENNNTTGQFVTKDPKVEGKNEHNIITKDIQNITEINYKKEKKELKKERKLAKKRIKKHRLLGGLVGAFVGLVVAFNTLIPVYGFLDILVEADKLKLENIIDDEISLSNLTSGLTDEIINGYNNSIFDKVSKYSGIKGLSLASFDILTSTKSGEDKITLREDISTIIETLNQTDQLLGRYKEYSKDDGFQKLSKEELSLLLKDTKSLINTAREIKTINAMSDYILPIAGNYVISQEMSFSKNAAVNEMIYSLINAWLESKDIDLFNEVENLVDIAIYLNDEDILTTVLDPSDKDILKIVKGLDSTFSETLTNKLYSLKLVDIAMPYAMNIGLTMVDDVFEFGYSENNATSEELKVAITSFLDKSITLAKTLDSKSQTYVTYDSLLPLGDFMQVVKTSKLINNETYHNAIIYARNKLSRILTEPLPDELKPSINNEVLGNISKIDDWKREMSLINQAITMLRHKDDGFLGNPVDGKNLREGASIHFELKEDVFANFGSALDILESSCLFGAVNTRYYDVEGTGNKQYQLSTITYLINDILTYVNNNLISDIGYEELGEVLNKVKNNLITSNHVYDSETKFWNHEFICSAPLYIELYSIVNSNEFEISSKLGASLDSAKQSTMFGNGACITFINSALSIVEDSVLGEDFEYNNGSDLSNEQTLDDKIYELFVGIKDNLQTNTIKQKESTYKIFWEEELDNYMALMYIAEDAQNLSDLNNIGALGTNLDNVFDSYTIPKMKISNIVAFAMKDIKNSNATPNTVDYAINDLIDNMTSKLTDEEFFDSKNTDKFWTIELGHIERLMNLEIDGNIEDNLTSIATSLDEVNAGYEKVIKDNPNTPQNEYKVETIRPSLLIEHKDIRNIIACAMLESKTANAEVDSLEYAINELIDSIAYKLNNKTFNNADLVDFWSIELGYVDNLINLEINENADNLDELGKSLDNITTGYKKITSNNGITIEDIRASLLIEQTDLRKLISTGIKEAKIKEAETDSVDEAVNELLDTISTKLADDDFYDDLPIVKKNRFWYMELSQIQKLKNLDLSHNVSDNLTSIGNSLDELHEGYEKVIPDDPTTTVVEYSEDIRGSVLIDYIDIGKIFAVAIEDVKISNATVGTTDYAINEMIDNIATKLSSQSFFNTIADKNSFWSIELSHIDTLNNFDFEERADNTLTDMGIELDTITDGYYPEDDLMTPEDESEILVRASYLLKHEDLGGVIAAALDNAKLSPTSDINISINSMIDNIGSKLKSSSFFGGLSEDDKSIFWMFELDYVDYLKNLSFEEDSNNSLSDMGAALDFVTDGYYLLIREDNPLTPGDERLYYAVRPSLLIERVDLGRIIASALEEAELDQSSITNQSVNALMTNIGDKLKTESFHNSLTTQQKQSFWSIELGHIDNLKNIDFSDDLVNNLPDIGTTLDQTTDGYESTRGSLLIAHSDLRNIIGSAIDEYKGSLTNAFSGKIKIAVENAVVSIRNNMQDTINIPLISFNFELNKIKTLSSLNITSDLFSGTDDPDIKEENRETLNTIGKSLDSIAFNNSKISTIYKYNSNYSKGSSADNLNSLITTRSIINLLFRDIFDTAIIDNATDDKDIAYNNLITAIKGEITAHNVNDSVISWQRELGFINTLTQLNMLSTLSFENVVTNIGSVVDGIAFNSTSNNFDDIIYNSNHEITTLPGNKFYDETNHKVYGNSLFITRTALLTTVHDMIATLEQGEDSSESDYAYSKADIINELLGNVTDNVADNNTKLQNSDNYYHNLTNSLNALTSIKTLIENKASELNESFDINIARDTDELLSDLQEMIISGAKTTRKIAIYALECVYNMLLNKATELVPDDNQTLLQQAINTFNTSSPGVYIISLKDYYLSYYEVGTTKDATTREFYVTTENISADRYPNPFVTLQNKIIGA